MSNFSWLRKALTCNWHQVNILLAVPPSIDPQVRCDRCGSVYRRCREAQVGVPAINRSVPCRTSAPPWTGWATWATSPSVCLTWPRSPRNQRRDLWRLYRSPSTRGFPAVSQVYKVRDSPCLTSGTPHRLYRSPSTWGLPAVSQVYKVRDSPS